MAENISNAPANLTHTMRRGGAGNPGQIEKPKDIRSASMRLTAYLKPYARTLLASYFCW